MTDLFSVAGKTALVTGGSRGIGYMIAEGLLNAGARVLIAARKAEELADAHRRLAELGSCTAVQADISNPDGARALARAVTAAANTLDILVNNAGATWGAPLEEFPELGWDRVMHTNVEGVFHLTVALLPLLRAAATADDPARIINIGSTDGLKPSGIDNYSYSASKAAVHMLTRHLAQRLGPDGITVNAIAPGPFLSRMTRSILGAEEGRSYVAQRMPLRRIGRPDDAAGVVIFLSSRAGAFLTGTIIPLDGGMTNC